MAARSTFTAFPLLFLALVAGPWFTHATQQTSELTLIPTDDTYIQSDREDVRGQEIELEVRFRVSTDPTTGKIVFLSYTLLKFNFAELPRGSSILSARLSLFATRVIAVLDVGAFYSSNNFWGESTLSWRTATFVDQTDRSPVSRLTVTTVGVRYEFDVTEDVRRAIGQGFLTEILKPLGFEGLGTGLGGVLFGSKENPDSNLRPRLTVTFAAQAETTQAQPTTTQTATGPSREQAALTQSPFLLAAPVGIVVAIVTAFVVLRRKAPGKATSGFKPEPPENGPTARPEEKHGAMIQAAPDVLPTVASATTEKLVTAPKPAPKIAPPSGLSTGIARLDAALGGGVPSNTALLLTAPNAEETDLILTQFLEKAAQAGLTTLYITGRERERIAGLLDKYSNFAVLVCHSAAETMYPGWTNAYRAPLSMNQISMIRLQIERNLMKDQSPKAVAIDIISPLVLMNNSKSVRFWLTDLIEKFKKHNCTILAHINPETHAKEDVRIIADIFDGELELVEVVEKAAKFVLVKRLMDREFQKEPVRIT